MDRLGWIMVNAIRASQKRVGEMYRKERKRAILSLQRIPGPKRVTDLVAVIVFSTAKASMISSRGSSGRAY